MWAFTVFFENAKRPSVAPLTELGDPTTDPRIAAGLELCAQDGARRAEYGFDHGLAVLADLTTWAESHPAGRSVAFPHLVWQRWRRTCWPNAGESAQSSRRCWIRNRSTGWPASGTCHLAVLASG